MPPIQRQIPWPAGGVNLHLILFKKEKRKKKRGNISKSSTSAKDNTKLLRSIQNKAFFSPLFKLTVLLSTLRSSQKYLPPNLFPIAPQHLQTPRKIKSEMQ